MRAPLLLLAVALLLVGLTGAAAVSIDKAGSRTAAAAALPADFAALLQADQHAEADPAHEIVSSLKQLLEQKKVRTQQTARMQEEPAAATARRE